VPKALLASIDQNRARSRAEVIVIFRQLFDPETSTYSYLLADQSSREAVLIDSVLDQFDRDVTLLRELDLDLLYALETHVHADHVTASGRLRETLGCKVGVGARSGVANADLLLQDGETVRFGERILDVISTPGHTSGCVTYLDREAGLAFTGDALLIRGCGRTDFQQGDAGALFSSVRDGLFMLPDETRIYPGHDYRGRMMSTVAEEKSFNLRLGLDKSPTEFVEIMDGLDLAYPKQMDVAVPANLASGIGIGPASTERSPVAVLGSVASVIEKRGRQDAEIWMGLGI
jgi:sulfur dioxygenase